VPGGLAKLQAAGEGFDLLQAVHLILKVKDEVILDGFQVL